MIISLERLSQCNHQERFLCAIPSWFQIQTLIFSALTPRESYRISHSCIVLYVDRRDLLLAATAVRLRYSASGFSVATPLVEPVPVLPLAVGQGGVWESDSPSAELSSRSLPSIVSDAVENQHTD